MHHMSTQALSHNTTDTFSDVGSAIAHAQQLARRREDIVYVIRDGAEFAAASEDDLDSWWQGATVLGEVSPEGDYEPAY